MSTHTAVVLNDMQIYSLLLSNLLLLLLSSLFSSLLYYSNSSLLYYSFPLYTTTTPLYSTILLSMFVNSEHIYFWLFLPSADALCLLSSCCFFAKSPLSSPLLCFADDEIVQVHTLYGI